jgi:NAD(P)H dehydrogenase (quinone)
VPPGAAREQLAASGMPDWLIQHLDGAFTKIRNGEFAATTDAVAVLTGRPPRGIGDFVTDHADAFAPIAQPA